MEECGTGGAFTGVLSVNTESVCHGMGRLDGADDTDPGAGTGVVMADVEAVGK